MIRRLLIANRGEIAVRIASTAREMGIETVGVYAEPDRNALHVDCVDLAVALGGSSPAESYLRGDAVLQAALDTGCDAVHPGYGFLAENAAFARSVIDAGLVWVGPTPDQIALLGDKVAAKKAAIEAGVPTTPIHDAAPGVGTDGSHDAGARQGGRRVAVAGGCVSCATSPSSPRPSSRRPARPSRRSVTARVFIEPYIEHGHHVEVQIMGDRHGNVVHYGERECSIQRRNQKIIEETPSPSISDETRQALWRRCARPRPPCRLRERRHRRVPRRRRRHDQLPRGQHPAAGRAPGDRAEIRGRPRRAAAPRRRRRAAAVVAGGDRPASRGHAIEVRIVAEDPAAGWLPSTGEITGFEIGDRVRVDTGTRAGSVVSADYDSLLAKVIGSRAATATRRRRSWPGHCADADVTGVRTNVDTLVAILREPDFLAGRTPTSYLDDHPQVLTAVGPDGDERLALLLAAVFAAEAADRATAAVWGFAPSGWRNVRTQGQRQTWIDERTGEHHPVEYVINPPSVKFRRSQDAETSRDRSMFGSGRSQRPLPTARWRPTSAGGSPSESSTETATRRTACAGGRRTPPARDGATARRVVAHAGRGRERDVATRRRGSPITPPSSSGSGPVAPLPGTVIAVHVVPGDVVAEGQLLLVLEAMKMEHKITAAAAATVAEVRIGVGDRVDAGDLLVVLERR